MKFNKILTIGFIIFFFFQFTFSFDDSIKIISRKEWGANEEYRYKDSKEWKNILQKWSDVSKTEPTEAEKIAQEKATKKVKEINEYLVKNYPLENTIVDKITLENGRPLAWPIEKSSIIKWIVIHHTETEYKTSLESMQAIYKYHALSRGWGDIGYNYVIGYDGEIYEWKAWGDYTVWAHALYNNRGTVGIALMGNMNNHDITDAQLLSLQKLILFLTKKYGIDLTKNIDFHKECKGEKCSVPMTSFSDKPIVGHRDVWYTACPGDYLDKRIENLIEYLSSDTKWFTQIKNPFSSKNEWGVPSIPLEKQSDDTLLNLLGKLEVVLDTTSVPQKKQVLKTIKGKIQTILKKHLTSTVKKEDLTFEDTKNIKIKLSYPLTGSIDITNGKKVYKVEKSWTGLLLNWEPKKVLKISSGSWGFLTISSWERFQDWDTKRQYNDNTFRWSLIIYIKNDSLVVVNEVPLGDYLAWLWEVSEWADTEKAKSIIISARTYARYYIEKERKFPWEFYDGSDNPNEFQRYLWYSFEKRSPSFKKLVSETKGRYITYKWNIIKPWYFSSSNGKTLSFFDYCIQWGAKESICQNLAKNYPYLQAVDDYGSIGKQKLWHTVWLSWAWATYFAERWWSAEMIIWYYLRWARITKS